MSDGKLSGNLSKKQKEFIRNKMANDLAKLNLQAWQTACKSFGPFNYNNTTRKMWFEKNKHRVAVGRKIILFVDKWAKDLRKEEVLSSVNMSGIRKEILNAIRNEMDAQNLSKNKINDFKLATFRTLVSWADDPTKLEEGPYEGKKELPEGKKKKKTSPRGRKSAKGKFTAPDVNLVKGFEMKGNGLVVQIAIINNYLHPYQNIELELDLDPKLTVKSVKGYSWVPSERMIKMDFIPASLGVDPYETIIEVNLETTTDAKTYTLDGTIHYDNTDKGVRESKSLRSAKIKL